MTLARDVAEDYGLSFTNPMRSSLVFSRGALISLIGSTLVFSACASNPAAHVPVKANPGDRIVLQPGQYKEVAVTGSNIPELMANTPIAHPLPTASGVVTYTPEAFQELVRRGDVLSRR
jgi:hypothetical protein